MNNFEEELLKGDSTEKYKKRVEWEKSRAAIEKITDKLGLGLDEDIKDSVATLNAMGIPTTSSCAGHTNQGGEGFGLPYIQIYAPRPKDWEENIEAQNLWIESNKTTYEKMLKLLNEFYENRFVEPDVLLILHPIGIFGGFRLRNSREKKPLDSNNENRIKKVMEYQNEMKAFGDFLNDKFMNTF